MNELVKKTRIMIIIFFLLFPPLVYFSLYLPLKNELEHEVIENYKLLADSKAQRMEEFIRRGREGTESISSRSVIRNKIVEYRENLITFEELYEFTLPRYLDGIEALDNVVFSAREVNDTFLLTTGDHSGFQIPPFTDRPMTQTKIVEQDEILWVRSPLFFGPEVIGYDIIAFSMNQFLQEIESERIELSFLEESSFTGLLSDSGDVQVVHNLSLTENYIKMTVPEEVLFERVSRTTQTSFIIFVLIFLATIIFVSYFLLRNANRVVQEYEVQKNIAEEASRTKSQFLANMSHELRTPLNGVQGFAELLTKTEVNKEQNEYLSYITSSVRHLLIIINDILDLSKIEARKLEFEQKSFDLKKTLEESVWPLLPEANKKNVHLDIDLEEHLPEIVVGDSFRLHQIVTNLLSNAVKFTKEGSIRLSARLLEKKDQTVWVDIEVEDSGIGIKEEDHKRIFDSFTQAEEGNNRLHKGTGLGLYITKEIISKMGGEISLQSEPGKGSVFNVRLPFLISSEERTNHQKETLKAASSFEKRRDFSHLKVLIAEDDLTSQILISKMFELYQIKPDIVSDGEQAVKCASEQKYDLIILDYQMPVLDGMEAIRQIRRSEANHDTKIVAVTAQAMKNDREAFLEAGFSDYISKPYTAEDLYKLL